METGVSPGYFATLGMRLVNGRDVRLSDDSVNMPVAVVDETVARKYWNGAAGALGKRIRTTGDTTWRTIVGVVGDVRDRDAASLPWPHLYESLAQSGGQRVSLAVRTTMDPARVIPALRSTIVRPVPAINTSRCGTLPPDENYAVFREIKARSGQWFAVPMGHPWLLGVETAG